jgi:hypothetical protein
MECTDRQTPLVLETQNRLVDPLRSIVGGHHHPKPYTNILPLARVRFAAMSATIVADTALGRKFQGTEGPALTHLQGMHERSERHDSKAHAHWALFLAARNSPPKTFRGRQRSWYSWAQAWS